MTRWQHTKLGERGEDLAARFLVTRGLTVSERRYRTRQGEIDLVCRDRDTVVFVEVKTRRTRKAGEPFEAITRHKQQRLTRLALAYLKRHDLLEAPARFDVVSILYSEKTPTPTIDYFRDAFPASGSDCFY
ncbi:MAG: YraN family protein [Planctomycetaceae bacterium]